MYERLHRSDKRRPRDLIRDMRASSNELNTKVIGAEVTQNSENINDEKQDGEICPKEQEKADKRPIALLWEMSRGSRPFYAVSCVALLLTATGTVNIVEAISDREVAK